MSKEKNIIAFLYGTLPGRIILKTIMTFRLDLIAVRFLCSSWSKPMILIFAKCNGISISRNERKKYRTYRDFFVRGRENNEIDHAADHLISPCDGWLSVFSIDRNCRFKIKNSGYSIQDLLQDEELAKNYEGGQCLIFRLEASDHHHYCYIDNGFQGRHKMIPGELHSVQPISCEQFPVYVLNKRCWSLLTTENFGPVVQCEIGALVVGGIYNERENVRFLKGTEKGHFEIAGSTIVLLFEKGHMEIKEDIRRGLMNREETRVVQGQWIGISKKGKTNNEKNSQ